MLQEEALQEGRSAQPLGRRAEAWLAAEQLEATGFVTAPERGALLSGLARIMDVFEKSSGAVAAGNGWDAGRHAEVRGWIGALRVS